jgi:hypothetical protein
MSGVAHSSYNPRGIFCNGLVAHALDRLAGEPFSREVASCAEARTARRDDALGTHRLRLEGGQGGVDVLGSDPPRFEVVPDEEVARATPCQQLGARSGEAFVVDRAGVHEPLDRFPSHLRSDVRPGEPVRELPLGEVPVRKRPRCPAHRLVPSQLVPQAPRSSPVELDSDVEARGEHDLGRQGPPRLALELDLDP